MRRIPWQTPWVLLAVVLCGGLLLLAFQRFVLDVKPENRQTLYAIHRNLRKSMTVQEVRAVVERHRAEHLRVRWSPAADAVTVSTVTGLFQGCDLWVRFQDDRLISAKVRGDDTPDQRLRDAPPDIE